MVGVIGPSSTGYGKLLFLFGAAAIGRLSDLFTIGVDSCRNELTRAGGLERFVAWVASSVLQSRSVLGKRSESVGVRGEGDAGREPAADPDIEP